MGHAWCGMRRIGAAGSGLAVTLLMAAALPLGAASAAEGDGRRDAGAGQNRPSETGPPGAGQPDRRAKPRPLPERDARPAQPDFGGCPYRKKKLDLIV